MSKSWLSGVVSSTENYLENLGNDNVTDGNDYAVSDSNNDDLDYFYLNGDDSPIYDFGTYGSEDLSTSEPDDQSYIAYESGDPGNLTNFGLGLVNGDAAAMQYWETHTLK